MTLDLTKRALLRSKEIALVPNLALEIDGIDTIFAAISVKQFIRYGDPDVCYGPNVSGIEFTYGGFRERDDQLPYISLDSGGTSTSLKQQLRPDQGNTTSTGAMTIAMVDVDNAITKLITPGNIVADLLGKKAKVWFGYDRTAFKEDYSVIHNGIIDDIESGPGYINLIVSHPDNKKRQKIYQKVDTELLVPIDNSQITGIIVSSSNGMLQNVFGPDGVTQDSSLVTNIRVGDEVIEYNGISGGNELQNVIRSREGTVPNAHSAGAGVTSVYGLSGNSLDLALKVMLSGVDDYWVKDLKARHLGQISFNENIDNAVYFDELNVVQQYGVTVGDYIRLENAIDGINNVTEIQVTVVATLDDGSASYVVVDDSIAMIQDLNTDATVSFRSQWDVLGDGAGLAMTPEEVDVKEHVDLRDQFLQGFDYKFLLDSTIEGKDFIDQQIYRPYALYSLPRKGKSSVGYTIGPVPGATVPILNERNILKPDKIKLKRTVHKNFQNTVVHKFDYDVLDDKALSGQITVDQDSKNRIRVGNKVNTIEARGMRRALGGEAFAANSAQRLLSRYKFAAEHFDGIEVEFGLGSTLEVGDVVIMEFVGDTAASLGLQVSNTEDGSRQRASKFYEIINRALNIKSGKVALSLVDTNQSLEERYGLIAPSSVITEVDPLGLFITIEPSYQEIFGSEERDKWTDYVGLGILIHDEFYTRSETVTFVEFDSQNRNRMITDQFTAGIFQVGDIIDIAEYSTGIDPKVNEVHKNIHCFQASTTAVLSGTSTTVFDVAPSDAFKFLLDAVVELHTEDFSSRSGEKKIIDVTGDTITVDSELGFTPDNTYLISFIGFADGGHSYRYV